MAFLPAEALVEPELCYVLDAVLFVYGIVLTILYCRLKVRLYLIPLPATPDRQLVMEVVQGGALCQ